MYSTLIEATAESWTPVCFHILDEIGIWGDISKRIRDGAEQFRCDEMLCTPSPIDSPLGVIRVTISFNHHSQLFV